MREIRATSLLTGLKPDRITASGVSSMIRSIPVADSRAPLLQKLLFDILHDHRHFIAAKEKKC
jgi:hypothetical protein